MTSRFAAAALRFVMTARSGLSVTWRGDRQGFKSRVASLWVVIGSVFNAPGRCTNDGRQTNSGNGDPVLSAVITPLAALFVAYGPLSQEESELRVALAALLGALSAIGRHSLPATTTTTGRSSSLRR